MLRKIVTTLLVMLLTGLGLVLFAAPSVIDGKLNKVRGTAIPVSEEARKLHASLDIVDLHCDCLLWERDLLKRNDRGHVDVPRLIDGNVCLQVFSIVTKVPEHKKSSGKTGTDKITILALADHWPPATLKSLSQRVFYQTEKLETFENKSKGKLRIIRTADDLDKYLEYRQTNRNCTAALLSIEGAHALDGDLGKLDLFYSRGIRMMSPSHFFDNDLGGSSYGASKPGLSEKGKSLIRAMEEKSIIVDLAHSSSAAIADALKICKRPVVVSHTGVRGTCDSLRNLSDSEVRGVAKTGGLIGIGYWKEAIGGQDARSVAKAIRYTTNLVGADHVALGSDFDGACTAPFDSASLIQVTQALIEEGFSGDEIRSIMGGNALRLLRAGLPEM